jgi:hypothetical protein
MAAEGSLDSMPGITGVTTPDDYAPRKKKLNAQCSARFRTGSAK